MQLYNLLIKTKMEKISIQIKIGRNFHFMTGSDQTEYDHFNSLIDPVAKIEYIAGKAPISAPWIDEKTNLVTWKPSLGNIYASLDPEFKSYDTVTGAYKEAVRIKRLLQEKSVELKKAFNRRYLTRRTIQNLKNKYIN